MRVSSWRLSMTPRRMSQLVLCVVQNLGIQRQIAVSVTAEAGIGFTIRSPRSFGAESCANPTAR